MLDQVKIVRTSPNPKYLQLAEEIIRLIDEGGLVVNERLPSVNSISSELNISRETVFRALKQLSEMGVVRSANRRGYFVQTSSESPPLRIFLMLDKMTAFKEDLYQSFHDTIGGKGVVDVFFHHHNKKVFENLITNNLNNYTHFVIVTFLHEDVSDILNLIPPQKRIILDCKELGLDGSHTMIFQDFEENIFQALYAAQSQLAKYTKLFLVVPSHSSHFAEVEKGFTRFIDETGFPSEITSDIDSSVFQKGNAYFTLRANNDKDVIRVIKLCRHKRLELGRDVGLMTYNDSEVKEILEGGITTVSTDFKAMGQMTARAILDKDTKVVAVPSDLVLRRSL